jgi:hypothetical protein
MFGMALCEYTNHGMEQYARIPVMYHIWSCNNSKLGFGALN